MDNFLVKEGKFEEFQSWIKKNEKAYAALLAKWGMKYQGTYYYALGTGAHVNALGCVMYELSKYGDMDAGLKKKELKNPEDERLTRESLDFMVSTPSSKLLLRPMGEVLR